MKKTLILFSVLFISLLVSAQSNKTIRELGLTFSNIDQFGLTYRIGTEKALWRFNALSLSGSSEREETTNSTNTNNSFDFSISVGRELRMPITNRTDFRIGADLSYSYARIFSETLFPNSSYSTDNNQTLLNHKPGFNLVFGLNVKLKALIIGAELKPSIQYTMRTVDKKVGTTAPEKSEVSQFSFSASNIPVQFSIVYPF